MTKPRAVDWPSAPDWSRVFDADRRPDLVHFLASPGLVAQHCAGQLVYLASPYSRQVVNSEGTFIPIRSSQMRVESTRAAKALLRVGVTAISPIQVAAGIISLNEAGGDCQVNPLDADLWERWCRPLLFASAAVVVPDIPGWMRSVGVWREVVHAIQHSLPVFLYSGPDDAEVWL